jgi:tetratricopeptide (TPR) repeat protein
MIWRKEQYWLRASVLVTVGFLFVSSSTFGQSTVSPPQTVERPNHAFDDDLLKTEAMIENLVKARNAVRIHPDSAASNLLFGLALKSSGDEDGASKCFDRAVELDSNLAEGWYQKGLIEADRERWLLAAEYFRRALHGSTDQIPARVALGNALLRLGRFEEVANEFNTVLHMDASNVTAGYGLGLVYLQEGNLSAAEKQFRSVLRLQPTFMAAEESLGQTLLKQDRWDEAVAWLRRVAARNADSVEAANALGTALLNSGSRSAAQKEFQRARELSLRQTGLLRAISENNHGLGLLYAGNLKNAAAAFRTSIAEDPDYAESHNNLGGVLWQMNDLSGALVEFQHAVQCSPNYARARNNLGSALLRIGETDEAIAEFNAALSSRPLLPEAHYNLGRAFVVKERLADAETELRSAVAIMPGMANAHIELGLVIASKDKRLTPEARSELQEGLRLDASLRETIPPQYTKELD